MRKKLKKSLSLVLAVIMLLGLLPMTSFAASGHYGNATYSDREGYFYTAGNERVYGWNVSVTNRSTGHEPTSFDLWFPDPFNFNTTYSGHVRYTAGEHGTGSYEEKLQATYYVSDYNYGYVLNDLPTEEELESVGIRADEGYAFNHYEITYWTRSSSSDSFTKKTDNFYPGDVMPSIET